MKTKREINEQRVDGKKTKKLRKQQKISASEGAMAKGKDVAGSFARHELQRHIVKILHKRGPMLLTDLIIKLDAQPSRIFRILKKLELKGVVIKKVDSKKQGAEGLKENRKSHHLHRESKEETQENRRNHHHFQEREERREKIAGRHHHGNKAGKACGKHHVRHEKHLENIGSLRFAINS